MRLRQAGGVSLLTLERNDANSWPAIHRQLVHRQMLALLKAGEGAVEGRSRRAERVEALAVEAAEGEPPPPPQDASTITWLAAATAISRRPAVRMTAILPAPGLIPASVGDQFTEMSE